MERQAKDGTFYRQVGADEWEPITRQAKDGTVYKKVGADEWEALHTPEPSVGESVLRGAEQGATLGFSDEIAGAFEAAGQAFGIKGLGANNFSELGFTKPKLFDGEEGSIRNAYVQRRDEQRQEHDIAREANPFAYGAAELGGAVTTSLVPGLGAARSIKGLAGVGAAAGGAAGLGASEADLLEGEWGQASRDAAQGAAFGAGAGAAFGAGGRVIARGASRAGETLKRFTVPDKANADQIRKAAKELGIEPTPGMLKDSEIFQKLENDLSKSPSLFATKIRRAAHKTREGMESVADDLVKDKSSISRFESGEAAKKAITKDVDRKFGPSRELFEDLAEYTKDIHVTERSAKAVARNIGEIPEVRLLSDGKGASVARSVQKALMQNPSVDEIKTLRGIVGKELEAATGADKSAIGQIYAKLGRLEESTIKRGVVASARNASEGDLIQSGMIGQLRDAKRGYREQIGNIKDFASDARLGRVYDPKTFTSKIDDIASERIQDRLFNLSDTRVIENLKTQFPEAYQYLREAKLAEIAKGASNQAGDMDAGRFLRNTAKLGPEAEQALFREGAEKLGNLRTVYNAQPPISGPSGTPEGLDIKSLANIGLQIRDMGRVAVYKMGSSRRIEEISKALLKSPRFQKLAQDDPQVFRATVFDISRRLPEKGTRQLPMVADSEQEPPQTVASATKMGAPLRGKAKWAQDGLTKINEHGTGLKLTDAQMQDPKTRELLIRASSLKPGTKAMDKVTEQIRKRIEGGDN